jgi:hypothetical protein
MAGPVPLGVSAEDGSSPVVHTDIDAMWDWCGARAGLTVNPTQAQDCARPAPELPKPQEPHLGAADLDGFDYNDLSLTGWAVLFGSSVSQDIRDQLKPLLALRAKQVGDKNPALFQIFDKDHCPYTPGQSADNWLGQMKLSSNTQVKPEKGVPFYLMIVASPEEIPFEFQYQMDIYWGVGRLWLENTADYGTYAQAVIDSEVNGLSGIQRALRIFAPRFEGDDATNMVCDQLVKPLVDAGVGSRQSFRIDVTSGTEATKDALLALYGLQKDRPAICFAASHGMLCQPNGKLQAGTMGALLTQDYKKGDVPKEANYLAARHLDPSQIDLRGTVHILCACYGAGWPAVSSYYGETVADKPAVAALPQRILARGGLAVLGHIDRAWSYSYVGGDGIDRTAEYQSILSRLTKGFRAGYVTDSFNIRWNVLAGYISQQQKANLIQSTEQLQNLWIEHDDARGYILHGDPAVQLNLDKLAPAAA